MKDALENEIIIGHLYGYSSNDTVFIGQAVALTKTRVTLKTIKRRHFLYGHESQHMTERLPPAPTVSVQSYHLFPIND